MTDSIFFAVGHNEESAKELIGDELIAALGDLSYTIAYTGYIQGNAEARATFEAAKEILNLKQSITVQWNRSNGFYASKKFIIYSQFFLIAFKLEFF